MSEPLNKYLAESKPRGYAFWRQPCVPIDSLTLEDCWKEIAIQPLILIEWQRVLEAINMIIGIYLGNIIVRHLRNLDIGRDWWVEKPSGSRDIALLELTNDNHLL